MNSFSEKLKSGKMRFVVGAIFLVVVYFSYRHFTAPSLAPRYITAAVEKGTLTVSVSATGQVSSSQQIDIKPEVPGTVVALMAKNGQQVYGGQSLLRLDARDQEKAVRDARLNLDSANLSMQKLVASSDTLSLLQAENAVTTAKNNLVSLKFSQPVDYQKAQEAKKRTLDVVSKAHDDSFNSISNAFLDLPAIITGLNDGLYGTGIGDSEKSLSSYSWNESVLLNTMSTSEDLEKLRVFITKAEDDYKDSRIKFDKNFTDYKDATRYSDQAAVDALLTQTLETVKSMAQAAKSQSNMYDSWVDLRTAHGLSTFTKVTSYQAIIAGYIGKLDGHITALLSQQQSVKDNQQAFVNADRDLKAKDINNPLDLVAAQQLVKEKEASLNKLKNGVTNLDIQQQQLTITQRENALMDAQDQLARTIVRAPFTGMLAKVGVKNHDPVTSGTTIATLITKQKIAEVMLNEVDVSKVKLGQKVTLKLDAFDTLTFTGQVLEVDTLGTVTQGVVSYAVKIGFDTQDDQVKPGMSVSVSIITAVKTDVLLVPSSAVKSQNGGSYVDVLAGATPGVAIEGQPISQTVETGISNDTSTEILSGAKEGDLVVIQTITASTTATTATSQRSLIPGLGGGGGGIRLGGGGGRGG